MPPHDPAGGGSPTTADREAELAALQTAFDEYIASSRELEDELDAELAKMQEKLAESSAANATLAAQIEDITPQLSSLEKALSDAKAELSSEREQRRGAELAQDEAEARAREAEGTVAKLREECDDAIEQLAFREEELEEVKLELEVEKERFAAELDEARASGGGGGGGGGKDDTGDTSGENGEELANRAVSAGLGLVMSDTFSTATSGVLSPTGTTATNDDDLMDGIDEADYDGSIGPRSPSTAGGTDAGPADEDDDYVQQLEDELENVTEQLIEAETRASELEGKLADAEKASEDAASLLADTEERLAEAEAKAAGAKELDTTNGDEAEKLRQEISELKDGAERQREELELTTEELVLVQEEMKAAEEDLRVANDAITAVKTEHKAELDTLEEQVEAARSEAKSAQSEADALKDAVREANEETEGLREEIENLTKALENARADRDKVLEEMDDLKAAFDEAEKLAEESAGPKEEALRKELMDTHSREVEELKEELEGLNEANGRLKKMVEELKESQSAALAKAAAAATAAANAMEEGHGQSDAAREAELQAELDKAMADLKLREDEADMLRSDMERRVEKTTKELKKAEDELDAAKSQLADTRTKLSQLEASRKVMRTPSPTAARKKVSKFRPPPVPFGSSDPLAKFTVMSDDDEDEDEESGSVFYRSHARSRKRVPHSSRSRARSNSPTTVVRLETDFERKRFKATTLSKKLNALGDQKKMSEVKIKNLEDELKSLQSQQLNGITGDTPMVPGGQKTIVLAQAHHLKDEDDDVEGDEINVEDIIESRDPKRMADELRSMSKKSAVLKEHNANLLEKVLGLQGNIQVCCRVRPMMVSERQNGLKGVVEAFSDTEVGCFDARTKSWKSYSFDRIWGPESTQRGVFQDVEPLALSVVDGFNATIFAYGQTSSGKSYTMEGIPDCNQHGISHRTVKKIFNLLHLRAQQASESGENRDPADGSTVSPFVFNIEVSMLEIYNDEVYDLLAPPVAAGGKKTHLDVRRGKDGLVEVPGLVKEGVCCLEDVVAVLSRGNENRATATTNMNEHSSRSHMILNVRVKCGMKDQPLQTGNLYLIDLAGSERVRKSEVEGEQLKEAGHINKSLSALGNVMEALDRKAKHVPYRDSKLTYLLQDSLGGNSRTMMVVNVSPTNDSYDETACSLQFATRVRRINIGTAKKNVTSKNLEETVNKLSSELKLLSQAKARSEQQMSSLKRENKRVQERLKSAAESRARSHDDTRTMSVLKKSHAEMSERLKKEKSLREGKTSELESLQQEMQKVRQDTARMSRQVDKLSTQVAEKEDKISELQRQLRTAKEKASAANHRARTAQIVNPRSTPSVVKSSTSPRSIPSRVTKPRGAPKSEDEIAKIRSEVEELLKKHDPLKVSKVDTLMEKFQGRETFLLNKLKQRYEKGGSVGSGPAISSNGTANGSATGSVSRRPTSRSSAGATTAQQRSDAALQKHMERMRQRKERSSAGPGGLQSR
eukprot:CAMPEP_0178588094 /NCGR_PEP_ID=MMETSP0697-20121206/26830_1 /TAXON_ID=265572 /ORGANISM="Extubocellulus spinifer, Strain CCMP396" /LENGTH=1481 /DNA_ID=CAMNT_0020224381 /DNA_START=164 /DNA_END=4609 /DNA_ORIENTATION=+